MLSIKGAATQTFSLFNFEVSQTLKIICFKEQNFSVKFFAYAKFGYGIQFQLERYPISMILTKLEKLPDVIY